MASNTEQRKIQIIADGQQVNATFNDMTAAARILQNELKKLPPQSEEFAKKSEQLKGIKKNMDDLRPSVTGNTKALQTLNQEFLQMTPLGGMLNMLTGAWGKMKIGVNLVTMSFHTLKGAIAATGIGLLVIALGTLINYLTTTQDGIDKVNKVLTPMKVIFDKLVGVVQNLGGNLFKGLGELLNGDLSKGFSTITEGAKQAGGELGKAFTDGIEQGGQLADMNIRIEKTEIELTNTRSNLNNKYQEALEIAKDQSKTEAERLAAAKVAAQAENDLLDAEQNFLDLKIERMKLEQTFNDTSREGYLELAQLEAQRTDFETQASKRRTKAKSLENTISEEINRDEMARSDAMRKKQEENDKRLAALRQEYLKASMEAENTLEDLKIKLMEEGSAKKLAQLELDTQRELEKMEERRIKLLENETITQEEREALNDQFTAMAEAKRLERKAAEEEIRAEEKQAEIDKQMETFELDQEREMLLLENATIGAIDAETRKQEALLEIQRHYAMEKLALLQAAGEGESIEALKLKNTILTIDQQIADGKIENERRTQEAKRFLQQTQYEAAATFLALGIELMEKDSAARKGFVGAYKAMQAGQIVADGVREVAAIWKNSNSNPMNALIPGFGVALATAQTALAVGRTGLALTKVRSQQFATGGATGSGKVIDMMMGGDGSWKMPDGTGTRWAGAFASGGMVGSPSFGVIGEKGSEWVGPNWMLTSPKYANIFGYLEAERRRATPFAVGGATGPAMIPQASSATADLQQNLASMEMMMNMSAKFDEMVSILQSWPTTLRVVNDPRDILSGIQVLNEIESDSRINR